MPEGERSFYFLGFVLRNTSQPFNFRFRRKGDLQVSQATQYLPAPELNHSRMHTVSLQSFCLDNFPWLIFLFASSYFSLKSIMPFDIEGFGA